MKLALKIAASAALLAAAGGCGREKSPDGLTSDQRQRLNEISSNLDNADVVDTSPDSLVATNDEWSAAESGEATPANAAATAPAANAAAGNRQ